MNKKEFLSLNLQEVLFLLVLSILLLMKKQEAMAFTLEDMGLDAKEDLNIVVMSDAGVQKFEVVAKNA